jgi:hypothetical protein
MSSAIVESFVMVDRLGGGALEAVLILGRRTRGNLEYHGPCNVDWDDGDCGNSYRSSCSLCSVGCLSVMAFPSPLALSSPVSGTWVLVGDASPVISVNSRSLE